MQSVSDWKQLLISRLWWRQEGGQVAGSRSATGGQKTTVLCSDQGESGHFPLWPNNSESRAWCVLMMCWCLPHQTVTAYSLFINVFIILINWFNFWFINLKKKFFKYAQKNTLKPKLAEYFCLFCPAEVQSAEITWILNWQMLSVIFLVFSV